MSKSRAPEPADAKTVEAWERRLREDPKFWGRFSLGLITTYLEATAVDEALPRPLIALEYLLVMDEHWRKGWLHFADQSDSASGITIPRWVFNALADSYAGYLASPTGTTLTDAFVGRNRQGARSHSPEHLNKRRRDFTLTFNVIVACLNAAKAGKRSTLNRAFAHVANEASVDESTVERAYQKNMPLLRPYLERMGAPIRFPD